MNKNLHSFYYEELRTEKGNFFEVASTHLGDERLSNVAIAGILADMGYRIKLLHNNLRDINEFEQWMPLDVKFPKHPDAIVDGMTFEFKTNSTGRLETFKSEVSRAFLQAPNVLIRFDYVQDLRIAIKGEVLARMSYLKRKGNYREFEIWVLRKSILEKYNSKEY
jgi:hypothetical protein